MNKSSTANISKDQKAGLSNVSSKAEGIVWCSVYSLASVFVVVGNITTIVLFAVNKRLRKKSLFLVINMAFADLILGAVSMPLYIYLGLGIRHYQLWTGTTNLPLEYMYAIADNVAILASLISASFISCERLYAIHRPFKHRTLTVRTYCIVIFIVWTLGALDNGLIFLAKLGKYYSFTSWLALGSISTIIICGCNFAIWRKFQHGNVAGSKKQNRDLQNERLTKILLFVSILALFCWLPFTIVFSVDKLLNDVVIPWRYNVVISFINYSNAFVNPVVYALKIPEFRQALAQCCQFRRRTLANAENFELIRNNKAPALTTPTRLRTLQTHSPHQQVKFDEEVANSTKE